MHLKH